MPGTRVAAGELRQKVDCADESSPASAGDLTVETEARPLPWEVMQARATRPSRSLLVSPGAQSSAFALRRQAAHTIVETRSRSSDYRALPVCSWM